MSKRIPAPLSKDEIEEELVNNDLLNSGGVYDEESLQELNLNEKKELLKGLKQSKDHSLSEPAARSPDMFDSANFPSLQSASNSNNRSGKSLKLPRKNTPGGKLAESVTSNNKEVINLLGEDDEDVASPSSEKEGDMFCLPGTVNDNAPPLPTPQRPMLHVDCPMYQMDGETAIFAIRRMLKRYEAWKQAYDRETKKLELKGLSEDLEEAEDPPKKKTEEAVDPYTFQSNSPVRVSSINYTKTYPGPRYRDKVSGAMSPGPSSAQPGRRLSSDSDCTEVEPIMKTDDPQNKLGDWITAPGSRQRNKRNRKQNSQDTDAAMKPIDVEFDFDAKWDTRTADWKRGASAKLNNQSSNNRRSMPNVVVVEEKVRCPICQGQFPQSKVENHAALCEGFSEAPMEVEEEN